MARRSRHIAYCTEEGGLYLDGRRAGFAAIAPFRLPRGGFWRDSRLLELGYGYLCLIGWRAHKMRPERRRIEKLLTSRAARILADEARRRWQSRR